MYQRTSVGLDVHALSVVACAIDGHTTSNGALPGAVSLPEGVVCAGKKPGVGRAVHRQKHQTSVSVAARRSVLLHTN
ncbi:hypothetical protein DVG80_16445 [Rhodococcus erythropolis]|nr:hypothetical protein DVG80_16445 [Rhodococcus erythropolis]